MKITEAITYAILSSAAFAPKAISDTAISEDKSPILEESTDRIDDLVNHAKKDSKISRELDWNFILPTNISSYNLPVQQQTTGQMQNQRTSQQNYRSVVPGGLNPDEFFIPINDRKNWDLSERDYTSKLLSRSREVNRVYAQRVHCKRNGLFLHS
jgi:hypothetical protein